MERVSIIQNSSTVILVVPHGADDNNTTAIAEACANYGKFNAVINRGFERSDEVDVLKDQADCNKINHVLQDVVRDEFLNPILRIKNRIQKQKNSLVHVFHIHGAGDLVHKQANDTVGIIIGIGEGKTNCQLTASKWQRNIFGDIFDTYHNGKSYAGRRGGKYAGRSPNNLNQFFRLHPIHKRVSSMQLEIPYCFRSTVEDAKNTGISLSSTILGYLAYCGTHIDYNPQMALPSV